MMTTSTIQANGVNGELLTPVVPTVRPGFSALEFAKAVLPRGEQGAKDVHEAIFRAECARETMALAKSLTRDECLQATLTPLIIAEVAVYYAGRTVETARNMKLEQYKKTSRRVREVVTLYHEMMQRDLTARHVGEIADMATGFVAAHGSDFQVFWFTVNGELKRKYPKLPHDEVRTLACITSILVKCLERYNLDADALIEEKAGLSKLTILNPCIRSLEHVMHEYIGEGVNIDIRGNVELCMKIFNKNAKNITFNLPDEA
jgi:hypothetical protein